MGSKPVKESQIFPSNEDYEAMVGVLDDAGLTKNGKPDFDKISDITGFKRDSVKVQLAPNAKNVPRWIKLLNFVGIKIKNRYD